MTEENYNYRTSQIMLRNQFPGKGKLQIPVIPKFQPKDDDFDDLLLIGFDKTKSTGQRHLDRMVHFFLYDYRFEQVWKTPDVGLERLSRYRAVLSPDFSMYLEMAPVMQLYNVFRNRWCGAYWASKGIRVVPTVNWGDESTFDFCFDGIEKGSVVAVSTYMASAHDNRCDQKAWFMAGYNEMLRRIEPEKIICYHTPFPEMQGDIIYVDYERSSWKYMDDEKTSSENDVNSYKIGGNSHVVCDTIEPYLLGGAAKGGGSAYGGKWRPNPNKPQDRIFIGPPNTVQRYFLHLRKGGYWVTVKYDTAGKAIVLRHETEHSPGSGHTNPHDHIITWNNPNEHPQKGPVINYPDGAPELKQYTKEVCLLNSHIIPYDSEAYRFKTISEFKTSMRYGAEVVIEWQGQEYGIWSENGMIRITRPEVPDESQIFKTSDAALDYMVGNDRLRDVITKVTVLDRTI